MFAPKTQNLTVADGQLAATATAMTTGTAAVARKLNVIVSNTGQNEETVVITYSRAGGTQRRVFRAVLQANWSARLCGLGLNADDTLYGATTNASVVDYLVTITGPEAPLSMDVFDDSGLPASAPQILEQLAGLTG